MSNLEQKDYLKVDTLGFDFCFKPSEKLFSAKTQEIIELHKKTCDLIVYNNKIVFSSLPEGIKINKKNINFDVEVEQNATRKEINVLFVVNGDIHFNWLLKVNKNANFVCRERFVCQDECKLNFDRQIEAQPNSQITIVTMQEIQTQNASFVTHANVFENATLTHVCANFALGSVLNCENITLREQNATAIVKNLAFANKNSFLPFLTQITHNYKDTTSLIKNFGFVDNEAKVTFDGVNVILKGKTKSNARQETKIYNLSPKAKSSATPKLIIDESNVKASHALSIGSLDENTIYYLMSRGISRKRAKEMMILGIADEVLFEIMGTDGQNNIEKMINNKIKE